MLPERVVSLVKDHSTLVAYVGECADLVGLRDWTVETEVADLPAGWRAKSECVSGRRYLRVTVRDDFREWPQRDLQEAILHELFHALVFGLAEHVHDLQRELARAHYESVDRSFTRELERVVDSLANSFLPLAPSVDW